MGFPTAKRDTGGREVLPNARDFWKKGGSILRPHEFKAYFGQKHSFLYQNKPVLPSNKAV